MYSGTYIHHTYSSHLTNIQYCTVCAAATRSVQHHHHHHHHTSQSTTANSTTDLTMGTAAEVGWNAAMLHLEQRDNTFTYTYTGGKVATFVGDDTAGEHFFADCHPPEEALPEPVKHLVWYFEHTSRFRPVPLVTFPLERILALRDIRGEARTGLDFAWRFLTVASLGNPNIAYPPIITDRMVLDMSCHLWASWNWLDQLFHNNQDRKSVIHMRESVDFARYMLETVNIRRGNDWYLKYLLYMTPPETGVYQWLRVPQDPVLREFQPLSTQHTSHVVPDEAYRTLVVRGMGRQIPGF